MDSFSLPSLIVTNEGINIVSDTRPPRPRNIHKSANSILFRGGKNSSLTVNSNQEEVESAEDALPMSPLSTIVNNLRKLELPNSSSTVKMENHHESSPPLITINAEAKSFQDASPSQKSLSSESSSPYKTPKRSNSAPTIIRKQRSLSAPCVSPTSERGFEISTMPPTLTLCAKKRKTLPRPEIQAGAKDQTQEDDLSFNIEYKYEAMQVSEVEEVVCKVTLPTLKSSQHPDLHCISPQTLTDVIEGNYKENFDMVFIIDCRFRYEYEGGHIHTAINIPNGDSTRSELFERFFKAPFTNKKVAIVFYCEFSSKRGPRGYKTLRSLDREANQDKYPKLFYPEVYLLDGGYKNFYENCKSFCKPENYVEMTDKRYCLDMQNSCVEMRKIHTKRSRSLTNFTVASLASVKKEYL